ncbi:hypothetical protein [Rhodococcus qingshengii]|uniref:hypothetical protein n=1 Tax=Rhodococcus qingshengii TaxID=334542 RepID=UPI001A3A9A96|nr:hypothetical protein [Rhodococcus qingshengii]ULD38912.1 hypothetical protein JKI97_01040 [Rhodococcus qingshengii]
MNATELLAVLSRHYNAPNRPKGWLLAPEIASPLGNRRADLIAAPLTHTGKDDIVGHELKVSRADVLAELADLTKHDEWAQYCHRWWLVVADPALVDGLDIPEHWGVMAPPSGRRTRSMTVLRPAPRLSPRNPSAAWMKLARWQSFRADAAVRDATAATTGQAREIERLTRTVEELKEAGADIALSPLRRGATELLEKIAERRSSEQLWGFGNLDAIVDAVLDVEGTRRAAREQRQLITRMQRMLAPAIESMSATLSHAEQLGGEDPVTAGRRT